MADEDAPEPSAVGWLSEDADEAPVDEAPVEEVTVWAPEAGGTDEVLDSSVSDWISTVDFESTEDVPIPERLVDQVIGQEAGSVVIKKAAEQRRHMLMIGDPGTGKSMLARSMIYCLVTHSRMFLSTRTKTMKTYLVFVPFLLAVLREL